MTPRLQLFITLLLHFEGISGEYLHRAGDDFVLTNDIKSSYYQCSNVKWFHQGIALNGDTIYKTAPGADRMSLSSNCSLTIKNITAEDAGHYYCRNIDDVVMNEVAFFSTRVYLSVLTVSPSPPDVDPGRDGNMTLHCSLVRDGYYWFRCDQNSIIWVDETGSVLPGEGDRFESGGKNNCVSDLMVKLQRGSKRSFTCQFVELGKVMIDAEYTLDFTDYTGLIIGWVVGGLMVVLVSIVMFLIIYRKKKAERG
ncbi:uncharacterized protein LOC133446722 isoform X2 [Cololabis saira]|uniref:uncharacterized protein LOC133446722 isoform X2 n=1 Tax=Cololabis saira TaxID=129043 RepID=UPI002AD4EFE9|nr:uncharacterized protein LOC133446722 isoform X2 [Cololabis saira]